VSFWLLFADEMKGFYKSKVMLVLWVGMPVAALLFHALTPNDVSGAPVSLVVSLVVGSFGGLLGSAILSTTIVNEKNRHVYELFLVRPVRRANLIVAKFFAVLTCLILAASIALITGIAFDAGKSVILSDVLLKQMLQSFTTAILMMGIACGFGLVIGTNLSSVPAAAILSLYVGNQLASFAAFPGFMGILLPDTFWATIDPLLANCLIGGITTPLLVWVAIMSFNRKQF